MINRYAAHLYRRDPYSRSWNRVHSRAFKTQCSARRWIERNVGAIETTRGYYHRDLGRADFGEIRDSKRDRVIEIVEPEAIIVPSVGELGITP